MPAQESEAIILRTFPLGEGDRLVSFFSRSEGRLRGVASGARKPKSRFASSLELMSHVRIWFFERETRDLVRINQCELIESFWNVQKDYASGLVLALASEVTEAILGEREVADANFRLLLLLARFMKGNGPPEIALTYFAIWTVRLGGWLPQLDRCNECGAELSGSAFASEQGGLRCANCELPGQRIMSHGALSLGRRMLAQNVEQFHDANATQRETVAELKDYMLDLIELHAEKRLQSRKMLRENADTGLAL